MKVLSLSKDGGPESTVWAYWLCEFKSLFSVALLRFDGASRDAYHEHAFNCVSWVLKGELREDQLTQREIGEGYSHGYHTHTPSVWPVVTRRDHKHKVDSVGTTWVLTFRGPWVRAWDEYVPATGETVTLTHGRKVVGS
jgi:hypothetical protein